MLSTIAPDPRLPHVQAFCRSIEPDSTPERILFAPHAGKREKECFAIVDAAVRRVGGERVIGWAIHEVPGVYIEAEFHAVWRNKHGQLVDITPRPVGHHQTTFLHSLHRQYEGRQVNNIRQALVDDPAVERFLRLCDEIFAIENEGELAYQHGEVALPAASARRRQRVVEELAHVAEDVFRRYGP